MKKQTFNRSNILSIANYLRGKLKESLSRAFELSWLRAKIKNALKGGKVKFFYKKKNGDEREAVGTLNHNLFNYKYKGSSSKENPIQVKYWDMDIKCFRSFRIDRLIRFEAI